MTKTLIEYLEQRSGALDANEVSELLGINKDTVYRYAKIGGLPSLQVGNVLRFDPKELAKWIEGSKYPLNKGIAYEIMLWLEEQAFYRGGPRFMPVLLIKALGFLNYNWMVAAERVARDEALEGCRLHLVEELKAALSQLTIPEQRALLVEIKSGRFDEPLGQHRDLLNEPEPGDDQEVE